MSTLRDRLKQKRLERGLSQAELAKRSGRSQSSIAAIESGRNKKALEVSEIARALGVSVEWLETGKDDSVIPNTIEAPSSKGSIPVISWVQAGDWCGVIDNNPVGVSDEWVSSYKNHGDSAFALKVQGLSMQNLGNKESFDPGDIILCDPERVAINGSLVVVRLDDEQEATFKKLIIEDGQKYLKPLNPNWDPQLIKINGNATICGVVFQKVVNF